MTSVCSIVLNNFVHDSRVLKECLSLKKAGYNVAVVALLENDLPEHESVQGIAVHRIRLRSREWSKLKIVQAFKYFELVYRVLKQYSRYDVIHCNDIDALPIGVLIKLLTNRRAKIIYDAHEYETEIGGVPAYEKLIVKCLERLLIRHADRVMTVSNAIADEYVRLYGIEKPALVLNTPAYQSIAKKNIFRERFEISAEQRIYLYQGGFSPGRGIEILLETFSQTSLSKHAVVFMGYGSLAELIQEYASQYTNIYHHEAVGSDVLLDYTCSADIGILFYENDGLNNYYCSPNKMFEYIMAELPVIVSNLFEMRKIVEQNEIGVVADNNTVAGLSEAVKKSELLDLESIKLQLMNVKKRYNWEAQEKVLLEVYGSL